MTDYQDLLTVPLPQDLASAKVHGEGEFAFLGTRWLRRQIDERTIPVYAAGGKVLLSAGDIRSLITARPSAR